MVRVLLLLEDYGELMFLQTVLKKIGLDVDGLQNSRSFAEAMLRMNPEVLVMTAYGKRVKGAELSQSVKKARSIPSIILLHGAAQEPSAMPGVDVWQTSPISATKLIENIAELRGLDRAALMDKFSRIKLHEVEAETHQLIEETEDTVEVPPPTIFTPTTPVIQPSPLKASTVDAKARQARYAKFLKDDPTPAKHGFELKLVQDQVKALRKEESEQDNSDLEKERKEFVRHLFKK